MRFKISLEDLQIKDSNGDSLLDYVFIYNSKICFKVLCEKYFDPLDLYKYIQSIYHSFIEKCALYNSLNIVNTLVKFSIANNDLKDLVIKELKDILLTNNTNAFLNNLVDNFENNQISDTTPPVSKTLIINHPDCFLHGEIKDHHPIHRHIDMNVGAIKWRTQTDFPFCYSLPLVSYSLTSSWKDLYLEKRP